MVTTGAGEPIQERSTVELPNQSGTSQPRGVVDARRHPRFKLEVNICVYPRNTLVVRGYTVDISLSGISAILKDEVPLGEVVRLTFRLPLGEVEAHALVRQKNAFRYGFQFVEASSAQDLIGQTCRDLAVKQIHSPGPS
ncbi:MAG TPA: PilZ domain-containing protein [Candidatus Acidoferrales bacterium]|nr:PilZ domain-containing protein [Candidatus Acidoferrales bacterium]